MHTLLNCGLLAQTREYARLGVATARRLTELVPVHCVVCGASATDYNLCDLCLQDLPRLNGVCRRCALPVTLGTLCGPCLLRPPPWQTMICAAPYSTPFDTLITRFKFGGSTNIATALGGLMVEAINNSPPASMFASNRDFDNPHLPDLLVPMPLHWVRLWQRGFNQAALLAQPIGQHFDIEIAPALRRHRHTQAQTLLDTRSRHANVRNAFGIQVSVRGRHVALVDDVATTCATAKAATRVLLQSGASSVRLWCCARAIGKQSRHAARQRVGNSG